MQKTPWKHNRCWELVEKNKYTNILENRFYNIKQRCENPNNTNYKFYGAKGITLEYDNIIDFYDDFYKLFVKQIQLYGIKNATFDRIDVDGNYTKDNIRITNMKVQNTNTTRMKYFVAEKDGIRVLSNNTIKFGKYFNVNGRSIGNCVRGKSNSCDGWKVIAVYDRKSNIKDIINQESVTTKIIV